MATLTTAQETRLRRKLSDPNGTVFTTPELNDMFDEAGSNVDRTLLIAFEELYYDAAKFNDYTVGQSSERKSQIFDHLARLITRQEKKVQDSNQVLITGARRVPPRWKNTPG